MAYASKKARSEKVEDAGPKELPTRNQFVASVERRYGPGTMVPASCVYPLLPRGSWGNLGLDLASGGGFARGRFHRILGLESSGKTQTILRAFSVNQDRCHNCWFLKDQHGAKAKKLPGCDSFERFSIAWIDAEGSWDPGWVERHGIELPPDEHPDPWVYVTWPEYAEKAVDLFVAITRSRRFSMVVLDSLAAMSPTDEIEKSSEDETKISGAAKLINRCLRTVGSEMLGPATSTSGKPAVFLINHLYAAMSQTGPKTFTRGGRGQNYWTSFDLQLERRSYMLADGTLKGIGTYGDGANDPDAIKAEIRYTVPKSKICPPNRSGEYWSYLAERPGGIRPGDIDCGASLLAYSERYGTVVKRGKDYVNVETGEALEASRERLEELLNKDRDLQKTLEGALLRKIHDGPTRPQQVAGPSPKGPAAKLRGPAAPVDPGDVDGPGGSDRGRDERPPDPGVGVQAEPQG